MPRPSPIARLGAALRKHGPMGAAKVLGSRLRERFFPKPIPVHHFDTQHGVDTGGLMYTRRLRSGQLHDPHITGYYGTSPSLFGGVIAQWQQTLIDTPYRLADFTLVDIGSGKGRVLMMASDLPFRRIIGVELNAALTDIARANLVAWNAVPHICQDINVMAADALTAISTISAPLAGCPLLLYLYNPFDEYIVQQLLDSLRAISQARSAPIDILYIHPAHADLFEQTPGVSLLWSGKLALTPEDTAVDAFNSTGQDVQMYRIPRLQAERKAVA